MMQRPFCPGGATGYPGDSVGRGLVQEKGMDGVTGVVTYSGCMMFLKPNGAREMETVRC